MTRRYLKLAIVGSIFTLSACAQQSEIRQMNQSVSTLSKEMTQLNQQTVKITQQNVLNAKSNSGVYLLPEAKTPARLKSQIGTLRMSLLNIAPDGDGTRLTLRIQGESNDPLPAFSATVASGQISGSEQELRDDCSLESGTISIGASETALHLILLDRLSAFHRQYPSVHLRVTNDSTPQAISALQRGLLDCAIVTAPV